MIDETEELELTDETQPVVEPEVEPEEANPLPTYITAEQHQASLEANNAKLIEQMRAIVQPQQATQAAPVQQDTRTPFQIAKAEYDASNIIDPDWVTQRALEIQSERQQSSFDQKLTQVVNQFGGLIAPIATNYAITNMAGGDQALAAEIQGTLASMGVGPDALQNEQVKGLILDASRARLADKTTPRKPMPGAAPATSTATNTVTGIEAKLTPAQRKQLANLKIAYPGAYDDPAAIAEEFGV